MTITINVHASDQYDIEELGMMPYTAWHHTYSITRRYNWFGTGKTAEAAAQTCLDSLNESRKNVIGDKYIPLKLVSHRYCDEGYEGLIKYTAA